MKRQFAFPVIVMLGILFLPSCSREKTGKTGAVKRPANVMDKTEAVPAARGGVPAAVRKRTAGELLAVLPCKLENKRGAFAAFPDNTTAGQVCFSLSPVQTGAADVPRFDIKAGGMYFIFHDASGAEPGAMKIMKWNDKGGNPCLESSCAEEIKSSVEKFTDPAVAGWTYFVLTPDVPADLSSGSVGYYGLVFNADEIYLPVFF